MLIENIEKLIDENDSTLIIKERLLLLKDQLAAYDKELTGCRKKVSALADMIGYLESEIQNIKLENFTLTENMEKLHSPDPHDYQCSLCGSIKLKRIESTFQETFGRFDAKNAFFICLDCGKEKVIKIDAPK